MQNEDTYWVAALRAGEGWAIDALYARYASDVLSWVIRLGGPDIDAEDTAQEVFIVALRSASRFRGDSRVSTWLFGITRRVLANARRRARIRRFIGLSQIPEPVHPDTTDEVVARHRKRRAVQRALNRLSEKHRAVLVLADMEERTAPEISEMLSIPEGTVYSRLHAARRAFKKALRREGLSATPMASERNVLFLSRRGT
ncbi:MAG: sigma-70 family RNA polymerase sigma factor [Myxococcota bacterium]